MANAGQKIEDRNSRVTEDKERIAGYGGGKSEEGGNEGAQLYKPNCNSGWQGSRERCIGCLDRYYGVLGGGELLMGSQRPPQIEPLTPRIADVDIHHILSYSNRILCLSSCICLTNWSVSFHSLYLLEHVICDL